MKRVHLKVNGHLLATLIGLATVLPADAGSPIFNGTRSSSHQAVKTPMAARSFDPRVVSYFATGSSLNSHWARCHVHVQNAGQNVAGIPVTFDAVVFDQNGNQTDVIEPTLRRTNNPNGYAVWNFPINVPQGEDYGVAAQYSTDGGKKIDYIGFDCHARQIRRCPNNNVTACLADNRFQASVNWEGPSGGGDAEVMVVGDEALFFFDNPSTAALTVQLFNQCGDFNHFWVFAAAATDVGYDLTVTDTLSGHSKVYSNPFGQPGPAITDTAAFATCP